MGKALYRKYRSKSLDEIIGQPHITTTLRNAIADGNLSHAYLFTGPRGVGKTSIARILAHEINAIDYEDDRVHLDIIEIDAASNRRIDEIRELRERVHTAPTSAKYKVYIIDEVHMLTKEAFNALLKTLEEPPAHVIFILATTEAHKLPETIVSRTQRFTFKPVEHSEVVSHLKHIAKQEGFTVDDAGLELIARHGGGSFRDSISLLDQVRSHGKKITLNDIQTMLGIAPDELLGTILSTLQSGDTSQLMEVLGQIKEQGYQAPQIAKQLSEKLRSDLLAQSSVIETSRLTQLLQKLLNVPAAYDPMAQLELALVECALLQNPSSIQTVQSPIAEIIIEQPPSSAVITEVKKPVPTPKPQQDVAAPAPKAKPAKAAAGEPFDSVTWDKALTTLKQKYNTLYSIARMAEPTIEGDELTLTFKFAFHQKRLTEAKNQQVITDILQEIVGKPIVVKCVVSISETKPVILAKLSVEAPASTSSANDHVATISNIFGGAEVLES